MNDHRVGCNRLRVPRGYVCGMFRGGGITHLYEGTFDCVGMPMCVEARVYSRLSVARDNISALGVCDVCMRRAKLERGNR
jgi:hypothetical protein